MEQHASTLYRLARLLHEQPFDSHLTMQQIITQANTAIDAQRSCLVTITPTLEFKRAYIIGAEDTEGLNAAFWKAMIRYGLIGYAYHSGRGVNIHNVRTDPRWPDLPPSDFTPTTGSAFALPLQYDETIFGVMLHIHPDVDYFDDDRVALLEEIGLLTGLALKNAIQYEQAREGGTRYQVLFDHAVVPMLLTDHQGYIVDANAKASEFLGFSRNDLIQVPIHDVNIASLHKLGLDDLKYNEERTLQSMWYDIDGTELPTLIRARLIVLEGQPLVEWVLQDVSVQHKLERLRRDLAAMVIHDLRGPLQGILSALHIVGKASDGLDDNTLNVVALGLRNARQLQRLVDSLVDLQHLEEGRSILNRRQVRVANLLSGAVQLAQLLAQQQAQNIRLIMDEDLPPIIADYDMLMRVVVNLIENAIKYTPTNGEITVSARLDVNGDAVLISVRDNGPGIPAEMRSQIFEKFNRVRYEDAPRGVGLGLAFCRLAVDAHGGHIWVEGESGSGSDFRFVVPTAKQRPEIVSDAEQAV